MFDVILEAGMDTLKILPFLYLSYFVLDFVEKKSSVSQMNFLFLKHLGPLFGALLGCIPQCGFSVIAASLYAQKGITLGTLVACFISTSDEALPLLLSNPQEYASLLKMLIFKIIIALISGYVVDLFYRREINEDDDFEIEVAGICNCSSNSWINAAYKTGRTLCFIFVINFVLGFVIYLIGEEALSSILSVHPFVQPLLAALVGFIPNCAVSVMFVELYMLKALTFGSMIAGLCTGAGVGMAVLWKNNKNKKENFIIMLILFVTAFTSGILIDLL